MSEESPHLQVWEKVGAVQTIQADLSLLCGQVSSELTSLCPLAHSHV